MATPLEQFNLAIQSGTIEECCHLYSLIDDKPVFLDIAQSADVRIRIIELLELKLELVWSSMTDLLQHRYDRGWRDSIHHGLNSIVKYDYQPDKTEFILDLTTDTNLIKSLRERGWTITVSSILPDRHGRLEGITTVRTIAENILIETHDSFIVTIDFRYFIVIEYLKLRGINNIVVHNEMLGGFGFQPHISLEQAIRSSRSWMIHCYLHYYKLNEHSPELIEQLKTLTPDEIIQCRQNHLLPILIELRVELPTSNQVLSAVLESNASQLNAMIQMFLIIIEYNPDQIERQLVKRLIEKFNVQYQYGAILVVIARYKLYNLEEYRVQPFIHHLLELTINKTKPFRKT